MARPSTGSVRLLTGSREPVRAATTQNITLGGLQTIDGIALAVGDRVLVKNQQDATKNGIYTASEGPWYRAPDARDRKTLTKGVTVYVQDGAVHNGQTWRVNSLQPEIGADPVNIGIYLSKEFADSVDEITEIAPAVLSAAEAASLSAAAASSARDQAVAAAALQGQPSLRLENIAHRCYAQGAPQNTILALNTAAAAGAAGLEWDMRPSADGTIWVYHDDTVDSGTTGTGSFSSLTDSYISALGLAATIGTPYADLRIPKNADMFAAAKRVGLPCYPEIKRIRTQADTVTMVNEVIAAGMVPLTTLHSFFWDDLNTVRATHPTIGVALLKQVVDGYQADVDALAAMGNGTLTISYTVLQANPQIVSYCRDRAVGIVTWTVNRKFLADEMLAIGVNKIMSDHPLKGA